MLFRVLTATKACQCMHDRLPPTGNGIYSGSQDLFKFQEISDNISEMLQYRDVVKWKTNRK